jgi:hypothetical protein
MIIPLQELANISQPVDDVSVTSSVLWFFLSPSDGGIFVFLQLADNFFEWERTNAFDSEDGDVVDAVFVSVIGEIVVNLSRT